MFLAKLSGLVCLLSYAAIVESASAGPTLATSERGPTELCQDLHTGFYLLQQTLVNTQNLNNLAYHDVLN